MRFLIICISCVQTAGFSVTRMEPLVVSVKRKMVIACVKTVSMVTNVIEVKRYNMKKLDFSKLSI